MGHDSPVNADVPLHGLDLTDPDLLRDGFPHAVFDRLRTEAPVWRHPATPGAAVLGGPFWVLSRHAEVQAVSRDAGTFSSLDGPGLLGTSTESQGRMLVTMDPPDHVRMRRLISAGFTPRMTARLEEQAREWARTIVDGALSRGDVDFVEEVAYQLPMHMIADIMGIPVADRPQIFEWASTVITAPDPRLGGDATATIEAQIALYTYAHELGEQKRRRPADDVWTTLINAEIAQPDGTPTTLAEGELDLFFLLLTLAGSETTRSAITGGLVALLEHPDQLARLRDDPGLMTGAVDEIIRWTSPVTYFRRTVTTDTEIAGVPVPAGDRVTMWYPSANRDGAVFVDPHRFDIARADSQHVAFGGGGLHYCLGANLAKREIRVMFEELFARVGAIEITGDAEWSVQGLGNPIATFCSRLPVRLDPR